MKTIPLAVSAAVIAITALSAFTSVAQEVTSGYQRLSDGVYAFTADGGDGGAVVGCEQGTDVKIVVLRDYKTIEKYFCVEQLALKEISDQPVLVSAGFDAGGEPSALIMGVPANPEAWPAFYKLTLGQDEVSIEKFETSPVAGVFQEPGEWAFICPFFARQETRDGFAPIYQTSHVYAMPDGSYAGLLWRENGIWKIEFRAGAISVTKIYEPAAGQELVPVWAAHRSPKGKLAAFIAETRPAKAAVGDIAAAESETGVDGNADSQSEDAGPESVPESETGESGSETEEEETIAPTEDAEDNSGNLAGDGGEDGETEAEPGDAATDGPEDEAVPAARDEVVNLIFVTAVGENVRIENVGETMPPAMMSCALAVDGRPFAFWFTPAAAQGEFSAKYWGLGFTGNVKAVPFTVKTSEKSAPPLAAMRALGLPGLLYEENGAVYLRMGNGSSPDWHVQEEFKIWRAAKQFGEIMSVNMTAYFILDGSSLFWHWHKNK